jgi:hypothetical protein
LQAVGHITRTIRRHWRYGPDAKFEEVQSCLNSRRAHVEPPTPERKGEAEMSNSVHQLHSWSSESAARRKSDSAMALYSNGKSVPLLVHCCSNAPANLDTAHGSPEPEALLCFNSSQDSRSHETCLTRPHSGQSLKGHLPTTPGCEEALCRDAHKMQHSEGSASIGPVSPVIFRKSRSHTAAGTISGQCGSVYRTIAIVVFGMMNRRLPFAHSQKKSRRSEGGRYITRRRCDKKVILPFSSDLL